MINIADLCHTYVEWDLYNAPAAPRNALCGLYATTTLLYASFHAFCVRGFAWSWSPRELEVITLAVCISTCVCWGFMEWSFLELADKRQGRSYQVLAMKYVSAITCVPFFFPLSPNLVKFFFAALCVGFWAFAQRLSGGQEETVEVRRIVMVMTFIGFVMDR